MVVCASLALFIHGYQGSTDLVRPSRYFFAGPHCNVLWCECVMAESSSFKSQMGPPLVDSCLKEKNTEIFSKDVKKIVIRGQHMQKIITRFLVD